tara:strand:- start:374 stop:658 length:285 start_codon:yes stop_codon:yes gene_type:complete
MNSINIIEYFILIKGNVQGVFFRKYAQDKAKKLNITGWVKNLETSDVEMCIQGTQNQCEAMIKWCHKGSPYSHVSRVLPKKRTIKNHYKEYKII